MRKIHLKNIEELHDFLGLEKPKNPFFTIIYIKTDQEIIRCLYKDSELSADFYSISLKKITSGEMFYGRTKYDYADGTLNFMSPKQVTKTIGIDVQSRGYLIAFNDEFIENSNIRNHIKKYNYFSYSVNEALHLSPNNKEMIFRIFKNIETEYKGELDDYSKHIILSYLDILLKYSDRFYNQQFLHRKEHEIGALKGRFFTALEEYYSQEVHSDRQIPSIKEIAKKMNVTHRYLNDGLKIETGNTAIENLHDFIINQAKNLLLDSNHTISSVAYELGFEYPQYFSRLFKKKVNMSPKDYRNSYETLVS